MLRLSLLLAPLFVLPVAGAATLTITLNSGQVIVYDMEDVRTVVYTGAPTTAAPKAAPAPAVTQRNWVGRWLTNESTIGVLTLTQQGNVVTGTYPWKEGRVRGTVSGNEFVGEWTQSSGKGGFRLTLSADGKTLRGSWNYAADGNVNWRTFTGSRQ